ncbi:hypothetical protein [Comamonas sp. B-9]|uniref:hypothetical protein n=1 Tax=Comamonas sp. B-9 TaxID=1055192 RepID=UPI0011DD0A91|nr:hypothetical protein [Comamonas sp. B-9]
MNYVCIGFDIRMWPSEREQSSECSIWGQNDEVINIIKEKYDIFENLYQLFDLINPSVFQSICDEVVGIQECKVILMLIPKSVALLNLEKFGYPLYENFDFGNFYELGLDVSDINGFYSALQNPVIKSFRGTNELFSRAEPLEVLEVLQLAGFSDGGHSPYCVTKIMALKDK